MLLTPLQWQLKLVTFWLTWSNMIPILSLLDPASHIFVKLFNHDPNYMSHWHQLVTFWLTWSNTIPIFFSLDPAGLIMVHLYNYDPNYVPDLLRVTILGAGLT
jgi:hypothetical protein